MDEREQFIELLSKQQPKKADAIVLFAGDRFHRVPKVAELYHAGHAPRILLTSNADNWDYGSLPSGKLVPELLKHGVKEEDMIWEETGAHTRAEAESTLRIARERRWDGLILVTSEHHSYRLFLTFLKAMRDSGTDIDFTLIQVPGYPEFHGDTAEEGLAREFERISIYQEKGDVASYEEGVRHITRNN
jgi:uncharacterized SAM-binding protein YcdF (DUF218 family)